MFVSDRIKRRALNSAVECHPHTVEVIGSNPIAPTIFFFLFTLRPTPLKPKAGLNGPPSVQSSSVCSWGRWTKLHRSGAHALRSDGSAQPITLHDLSFHSS